MFFLMESLWVICFSGLGLHHMWIWFLLNLNSTQISVKFSFNLQHSHGLVLHPAMTFSEKLEERWKNQKDSIIWKDLTKYRGSGRIVSLCYISLFLLLVL